MTGLLKASKDIQRNKGLAGAEEKHAIEAFVLLIRPRHGQIRLNDRGDRYYLFLKDAEEAGGLDMVLLCAVALGKSTVGNMSNKVKKEAPLELLKQKSEYESEALRALVEGVSEKGAWKPNPASHA